MRISKALLPMLVAVLAGAGLAAGVSAADNAEFKPTVPEGFQRIVDDTGTIAIAVPATWSIVYTEPAVSEDRTVNPTISAAQPAGIDAFPSVIVWAEPYRPDAAVSDISWCDRSEAPYTQGELTGSRAWYTNCVDSGLIYQDVVVSPPGEVITVMMRFAYVNAEDEPTVDAVASSLEVLATEYPPPSATGPVGCFVRCHEEVASPPVGGIAPPPAVVDPNAAIWPYGPFYNVPQLGTEPVRGSGCGSQGQIGDVIPDGLWAGFVTNESTPTVSVDLLCIFTGAAAQHVRQEGTANIINDEPDYLVVNNNTRQRSVPAAPGIVLRDSAVTDGSCTENAAAAHNPSPARQAWVRIEGGQATWILWGCGFPAMPAIAQPANLAPAYPDYSDGVGSVWPYVQFWNVPQLGREPSRGSGCGASGQLGATIPDGLWAGFVTGYDAASNSLGIDVLCIFAGDTAQAVIAEGTANIISDDPQYLIVNNNPQVRVMPSGLATIITGEVATDGQCVEGTHNSPESVDLIGANTTRQAWIRIDHGVVTWIFYGC